MCISFLLQTYGASNSWTATHVYAVGSIAQALTDSEITALTDLDIDAMFSIGRHDGWEVMQVLVLNTQNCSSEFY